MTFNGPMTQGTGPFGVAANGALQAYSLVGFTGGAALQTSLIVGGGTLPALADSCIVACGNRVALSPQPGVHLGARNGTVQGITIATIQGAALFGGEVAGRSRTKPPPGPASTIL